jgi:hypothetical protein
VAQTATPGSPTPTPTPESGPQRLTDTVAAAVAAKCQVEINKAALGLVAGRLKSLDVCVNGIFKCIQTKPKTDTACVAKAAAKCAGERGKLDGAAGKLGATVRAKCGAGIDPAALFGAPGLDFSSLATRCGVSELANLDNLTPCFARELACGADHLFGMQQPRAGELLQLLRDNPAYGPQSVPPTTCLAYQEGSGESLTPLDPVVGKLISGCATGVAKASTGFLGKALKGVGACVNKAVACVQNKPKDTGCIPKARLACEKELGKLEGERAKLDSAVDKKCKAIDFETTLKPREGSNLGALTADDLGVYKRLLKAEHECAAGDLITLVAPRADEMFGVLAPSISLSTMFCSP